MADIEQYGSKGSTSWSAWEYQYEEIRKGIKFGKNMGEKPYLELQKKILNELLETFDKEKMTKRMIKIGVAFSLCFWVFCAITKIGYSLHPAVFLALLILPTLIPALRLKSLNKYLDAISDFDKKFFDGQIIFSVKNNLPL